jgi:hypothetical protein
MARTLLVLASLLVLIAAALLAPSPLPPTQGMLRSRLAAALASSSRSRPTISLVRPFSISSAAMAIDLPPFPPTRRDEDKVLVFQSKKDGRVEIKDRQFDLPTLRCRAPLLPASSVVSRSADPTAALALDGRSLPLA